MELPKSHTGFGLLDALLCSILSSMVPTAHSCSHCPPLPHILPITSLLPKGVLGVTLRKVLPASLEYIPDSVCCSSMRSLVLLIFTELIVQVDARFSSAKAYGFLHFSTNKMKCQNIDRQIAMPNTALRRVVLINFLPFFPNSDPAGPFVFLLKHCA